MSATLFIGAVGLTVNCALALLALRMVMRLDRPLFGDAPAEPPAAIASAAVIPFEPAKA